MKRLILILALCLVTVAASAASSQKVQPTKNLIVMITDGTSNAALSIGRWYQYHLDNSRTSLNIDPYVCGLVRTFHVNSPIVASSGAMSSYMTGKLVTSNNISVYPKAHPGADIEYVDPAKMYQPLATVLEAMKLEQKKATGLVATIYFPHATPAACSSHAEERGNYDDIKYQMASQGLDVLFSGGTGRIDDAMMDILESQGITYYKNDYEAFKNHKSGKVWSLFGKSDMDFEIDRDPKEQPSLKEMTEKAIELLSKDKDGFFLMVEGSKVDHAAHANDPITTITEFLAFDEAVGAALDFAKKDGNTTVVILPDHGTANITMGDKNYSGYYRKPVDSVFVNMSKVKMSYSKVADKVNKCKPEDVKEVFEKNSGLTLKPAQLKELLACKGVVEGDYMQVANSKNASSTIAKIYQQNTHIGFHGGNHTGEDVFLAIYHPKGTRTEGIITNVQLNEYLCKVAGLKVSLDDVTKKQFVSHKELFLGAEFEIVGEKEKMPQLVVRKGGKVLKTTAYTAEVEVDGVKYKTQTPVVFLRPTALFYLPAEFGKML
jgi:alkaline phosphatase